MQKMISLYDQAEAIKNKIAGLDTAMGLLGRGANRETTVVETAIPQGSVKALILDLAREAKAEGLNANIAVQMAAKHGVKLLRGTAASNLSRLKADNALVHDGNRYRLPEFVRPSSGGFSAGHSGVATAVVGTGGIGSGMTLQEMLGQVGATSRSKNS
jgi:hypothetical protein